MLKNKTFEEKVELYDSIPAILALEGITILLANLYQNYKTVLDKKIGHYMSNLRI